MLDVFLGLIQRAQTGDKPALAAVYAAYADRLRLYVTRRLPRDSRTDAEEILQDIQLKLVAKMTSCTALSEAVFEGWLFRLAANVMVDHLRRRQRSVKIDPYEESVDSLYAMALAKDSPSRQLARKELVKAMEESIAQLPPSLAVVIQQTYFESASQEEISRRLGITDRALRMRLNKARSELGRILGSRSRFM
ncbi:MAG: RNA polymerase sigma factor [Phycisphaeraceae bacterium]|nr:RNA polymerase sigma factor [Phycisphaeraceae bacterium]